MIHSRPSTSGTPKPIAAPMLTFEQGDVIRVPFPYTDRETRQHRPALVVSRGGIGEYAQFLRVVMITSAENRRWPDDQDIGPNLRDLACRLRQSFDLLRSRRSRPEMPVQLAVSLATWFGG